VNFSHIPKFEILRCDKTSAAPKGMDTASVKPTLAKATHSKSTPEASVAPKTSVPLKARAPSGIAVSKTAVTVTTSKVGVLRINTGAKRSTPELSPRAKGK
jgi:hypothetical protein